MADVDGQETAGVTREEIGGLAGSFNRIAAELERTVKALAAERDRFEAVLQSMNEAVLAIDRDRTVIAVNRAAGELLELERDVVGMSLLAAVRLPEISELARAALAGETRSREFELESSTAMRRVLVRATPQGNGGGAVLVLHDVTEVRRLEIVRRDFVANVSHELRTPVSIIQANTETLLSGALEEPEQARRFLQAVQRNAERLGQLISDLLDISRIEAGKYQIDLRPLRCGGVFQSVSKGVSEACQRRDVTLTFDVGDESYVRADAGALEQILVNLVENAVKYGPEGATVKLSAKASGAVVRLEVSDEGPGIEPAHRGRVFERFYRVDPGRSRNMGGTGLGLAIVKNLAEAMGGDVGVEPNEPQGCTFWVRLTAATRPEDTTEEDA